MQIKYINIIDTYDAITDKQISFVSLPLLDIRYVFN